jgi:hypothetical protein
LHTGIVFEDYYLYKNPFMEKTLNLRKVVQVLRLKCPNCGKANVFYKAKYPVVGVPKMRETCDYCGYKFEKEPGYFAGAAYITYGLGLLEGILAFFLARYLIFGLSKSNLALITLCAVLFCISWNYRLARVIWMNIYPARL